MSSPVHDSLEDTPLPYPDLANESEVVSRHGAVEPDDERPPVRRNIFKAPELLSMPQPVLEKKG